jgi:hypothetical protein
MAKVDKKALRREEARTLQAARPKMTPALADAIRLAPLSSEGEHRSGGKKRRKIDWGIWLERPGRGRMLTAEVVCLVGMIAWGLAGLGIYLEHRGKEPAKTPPPAESAAIS